MHICLHIVCIYVVFYFYFFPFDGFLLCILFENHTCDHNSSWVIFSAHDVLKPLQILFCLGMKF